MSGFAEGSWKMKGLDEGQPAGGGWKLDSSFLFVGDLVFNRRKAIHRMLEAVAESSGGWKVAGGYSPASGPTKEVLIKPPAGLRSMSCVGRGSASRPGLTSDNLRLTTHDKGFARPKT